MILSVNNLSRVTESELTDSADASLRLSRQSIQARMVHRRGDTSVLAGFPGGWARTFKGELHGEAKPTDVSSADFQAATKTQPTNFKWHSLLHRYLNFESWVTAEVWNSVLAIISRFIPVMNADQTSAKTETFIGRGLLSEHLPIFFPRCLGSLGAAGSQRSTVRQRIFFSVRSTTVRSPIHWRQQWLTEN